MSEWQPIETAPRDHTRVLGYSPFEWDGEQVSTTYCDGRGKWRVECKFSAVAWDSYEYDEWEPTHWQPLPKPPGASE